MTNLEQYIKETMPRRIADAETSNELNRIIAELNADKAAINKMQVVEIEGDFLNAMDGFFTDMQFDLDNMISDAEATIEDMNDEDEDVRQFGTYAQQVERTYNGGVL